MSAISRIGDYTLGEFVGCFLPATPILDGSPNVFANGKAVATIGSNLPTHQCNIGNTVIIHSGRVISTGSGKVFVNGKAAASIGSQINCGDTVANGSPNVFVGL